MWVGGQWWWVLKMILVFKQSYQYWELYLRNHRMIYIQISKSFYLVFVEWWVVVGGGGGVGKGLNDSSVPTEQGIYDWIDTGTK